MRHPRSLALLLGALVLAGCALGQRPTLSSMELGTGATTGQAPVDTVLALLDGAAAATGFTAAYDVLRTFGAVRNTAQVTADDGRRAITVGHVRMIYQGTDATTCRLDGTVTCSPGANLAALSDTGITTPDFYASAAARRLRRDALSIVGPPVGSTKEFAGQPATCVAVPLSAGTSVYCALANGVLAESDDGSVHVTLTSYAPAVTEALFSTTG